MHLVRDDDPARDLILYDADRIDFAGGSVSVSFSGPRVPLRLWVRHEGNRVGEIGFDGGRVSFSGEPIGVLRSAGDDPDGGGLRIELNARATTAAVEALVENLMLSDPSGSLAVREAFVTLSDRRGQITTASFALRPAAPFRPLTRAASDARPRGL